MHARLRELILSGELAAESRISEASLAVELGVSRTPLREALRMLAGEGLVDAQRYRQTRVAAVSPLDLEQLYTTRLTLEGLGAALTVPELTPSELIAMRECLVEMEGFAASGDVHGWEEPHARFHDLLVSHSGDRLKSIVSTLSDHSYRYRAMYLSRPWALEAAEVEHVAIADAYDARDGQLAASRLARHLARTALTLLAIISPDHNPKQLRAALARIGTGIDGEA